jgi:hypothetical protein
MRTFYSMGKLNDSIKLLLAALLLSLLPSVICLGQPACNLAITSGDGNINIYNDITPLATTSNSLATVVSTLGVSLNPAPVISRDSVFFNNQWVRLPTVHYVNVIAVAGHLTVISTDSVWSWEGVWKVRPVPSNVQGIVTAADFAVDSGYKIFAFAATSMNAILLQKQNMNDAADISSLVIYVNNPTAVNILMGPFVYQLASNNVLKFGSLLVPADTIAGWNDELCVANWCFIVPWKDKFPEQNTGYLLQPYELLLDTGNLYYQYSRTQVEGAFKDKACGNFIAEVTNCLDSNAIRQRQIIAVKPNGRGVKGPHGEQRLFVTRFALPGWNQPGHPQGGFAHAWSRQLGASEFITGEIFKDSLHNSVMNIYDSLGAYVCSFPLLNPHDGILAGKYSVQLSKPYKNRVNGNTYFLPQLIDTATMLVDTPLVPSEFSLLRGDSCLLITAETIDSNDVDHGNSIDMFWNPAMDEYVILKSSRNQARYPKGHPLSAWDFNPGTGKFNFDTVLTRLLNTSNFGINRSGGHNFKVDVALPIDTSYSNSESWHISQYDDQTCNYHINFAVGHEAVLHYINRQWSITNNRFYQGSHSEAMGNIGIYTYLRDTLVVMDAGAADNTQANLWYSPQVGIYNYESEQLIGGLAFDSAQAQAYQVNPLQMQPAVPNWHLKVSQTADSIYLTADSLPDIGSWYWWLGEKPATRSLAIPRSACAVNGGIWAFISGWYLESDTLIYASNAPHPRWISYPVWVADNLTEGVTEIELETGLRVYPNPAHSALWIQASPDITRVDLLDLQGRLVRAINIANGFGKMDVAGLAAGIYFAKNAIGPSNVVKVAIQ